MTPAERIAEIADRQRRREERANKPWNRRRARGKEIDDAVRAARAIDQRLPEESDKDHAKRLGLLGEARTIGGKLFGCAYCADLPHRRHADGCRGCGLPFEPESIERQETHAVSNASFMDGSLSLGHIGIERGGKSPQKRKRAPMPRKAELKHHEP